MTQFTFVADPVSVLTAAATGITGSGPFNVYYAITYNSTVVVKQLSGQSRLNRYQKAVLPGLQMVQNTLRLLLTIRHQQMLPAVILYAAISLQGTTPVASDLAQLKSNIAIADTSFVDNGQLPFNLAVNTAPDSNSTAGIKASNFTMSGTIPVAYGDPDNPYDIYFGALTDTGVSFGANNGAQRLPLLKGTNYYPTSVIGFRNNQNIPNLLAYFWYRGYF
jgi:hypothetical protein